MIPIGLLLILGLLFFCWRRRKRRRDAGGGYNGQTISGPRPLRLAANYGASTAGAGVAGVGAGAAAAGRSGRGGGGGRGRNASNESFGTTPSAIGVAVSEPRSKWGRRSLVEAIAGGVMMSSSGSGNPNTPSPSTPRGGMHSRQESLASSIDRGTGGYNSKGGYRPGMPRPFSPVTAQDPFQEAPSIIAVPPPTRRPASLSSGSDQSLYDQSHESNESLTARLARPITSGYPLSTPGVESRTSTEGEQGYWTADAGINSSREAGVGGYFGRGAGRREDEEEEELSPDDQPPVEPVNFGSGSSNSSGGSTPVVGTNTTPRLGSGHGSRGYRRGDSSWWN